MANSGDSTVKAIAFRLMTSVVNYDLSSAPAARRTTEGFDADWKLYLHVTRKNGVRLDSGNSDGELVADCSCREFDAGIAITDSFQQQRSLHQKLVWQGRACLPVQIDKGCHVNAVLEYTLRAVDPEG